MFLVYEQDENGELYKEWWAKIALLGRSLHISIFCSPSNCFTYYFRTTMVVKHPHDSLYPTAFVSKQEV